MGNVSKRQQIDKRAENSRRPSLGLQYSEKIPHPKESTFTEIDTLLFRENSNDSGKNKLLLFRENN